MSLFTELMDQVLEQDPNLSLECFLSARRYIQTRWRALHGTPMPEDALTLFLADPSRGDLTEEQRAFAKARRDELYGSFDRSAFSMLLFQTMSASRLVSGLGDFCKVLSPPGNPHA